MYMKWHGLLTLVVFYSKRQLIVLAWLVSDTGSTNASAGYQVAIRQRGFLYPARMGIE